MNKNDIQLVVDGLLQGLTAEHVQPISIPGLAVPKGGKYDEEEFVLVISDLQAGHKTKTFNFKVLKQRMKRLVQATQKIVAIHRKAHPVKKLSIFLLGDLIQSERIGFLVSLDELEAELKVQLFDVAIPVLMGAVESFAKTFEKVDVFCVRGNHASGGKFAATNTNWDDVAYRFMELAFRTTKHIEFHIADNFYQIAKVGNTKFMLVHGDQIRMWMNIPAYGITQRLMRWQGSVEEFDVLILGHFHNFAMMDWNDKMFIVNGTFVTDDAWVQKTLGLKGSCSQILLGVHPRVGISFVRKIYLDKQGG